jgi:hypothetical protein
MAGPMYFLFAYLCAAPICFASAESGIHEARSFFILSRFPQLLFYRRKLFIYEIPMRPDVLLSRTAMLSRLSFRGRQPRGAALSAPAAAAI